MKDYHHMTQVWTESPWKIQSIIEYNTSESQI